MSSENLSEDLTAIDLINPTHPAWIEIDLQQFKQNLTTIRNFIDHMKLGVKSEVGSGMGSHSGHTKLLVPIKANAYGHGLIPIARAARDAKVDYLGVSCSQEGVELRKAGITLPILVMGAIHEEQIPELLNYGLEFTIASLYKAKMVAKQCLEHHKKCKVHIEIETGMQRTGVRPETALEVLNFLYSENCFEVTGIYSHLATSDNPNSEFARSQIKKFQNFIKTHEIKRKHPSLICHISNSGGLCYFPESHMDMVRPGILTFGYFPGPRVEALNSIQPILAVKAKISFFKVVSKDQGISYGLTYRTKEETRVVTVPIGYGDGLRRELSNRGSVIIRGKRYPIAGTICMDQFMVDIDHEEAFVGDEVVLVGRQGNEVASLEEMARLCHTIPYEILCGFNNRLPRRYQGSR